MRKLSQIIDDLSLGIEVTSDGTDKGWPKGYIEGMYSPLLEGSRYRDDCRVLEIGIRSGASMMLWSQFFPNGHIVGIDNKTDQIGPRDSWTRAHNIEVVFSDAYSVSCVEMIKGSFDLIIDDGPHSFASQKWAIQNWLKRLAPNGILIIEDIQGGIGTAYRLVNSVDTEIDCCIHIIDLRAKTGQGDALAVCLHIATQNACEIPLLESAIKVQRTSILYRCKLVGYSTSNAILGILRRFL